MKLRADPDLIDLDSVTGLLVVAQPGGLTEILDLPPLLDGEAVVAIATPFNGDYQITPHILARRVNGRLVNVKPNPLVVHIAAASDIEIVPAEPTTEPAPQASINWIHGAAIVLGGNALIGIMLGGLWLLSGQPRLLPSSEVVVQ